MSRKIVASPADVRTWAQEQGLTVGTRGKLPPEVIKAYNDSHKHKYVQGAFVPTIKVSGVRTNDSGRKTPVTKVTTNAEVRAAAVAAGVVKAGSRGRLSQDVLTRFAAGTL